MDRKPVGAAGLGSSKCRAAADEAVAAMNGAEYQGRRLTVNEAQVRVKSVRGSRWRLRRRRRWWLRRWRWSPRWRLRRRRRWGWRATAVVAVLIEVASTNHEKNRQSEMGQARSGFLLFRISVFGLSANARVAPKNKRENAISETPDMNTLGTLSRVGVG